MCPICPSSILTISLCRLEQIILKTKISYENGYIITWILHQIFMFSYKGNDFHQSLIPSPTIGWTNWLSTIFPYHNIHVYSTSIHMIKWEQSIYYTRCTVQTQKSIQLKNVFLENEGFCLHVVTYTSDNKFGNNYLTFCIILTI